MPAHLQSGDFESSFVVPSKIGPSVQKEQVTVMKTDTPKKSEGTPEKAKKFPDGKVVPDEAVKDPVKEEKDDDSEDEDEDGDWNSEDDPDRLWCICKQPHNNRFMICCDTCLDWYHGKCVGITKKMGSEMEEAGNEWRCPKCKRNEENAQYEKKRMELNQKLKEREEDKKKKFGDKEPSLKRSDSAKSLELEKVSGTCVELLQVQFQSRPSPHFQKSKERTCFVCENPPKPGSIYCSDECIRKHASKARATFKSDKSRTSVSLHFATHPQHITKNKARYFLITWCAYRSLRRAWARLPVSK